MQLIRDGHPGHGMAILLEMLDDDRRSTRLEAMRRLADAASEVDTTDEVLRRVGRQARGRMGAGTGERVVAASVLADLGDTAMAADVLTSLLTGRLFVGKADDGTPLTSRSVARVGVIDAVVRLGAEADLPPEVPGALTRLALSRRQPPSVRLKAASALARLGHREASREALERLVRGRHQRRLTVDGLPLRLRVAIELGDLGHLQAARTVIDPIVARAAEAAAMPIDSSERWKFCVGLRPARRAAIAVAAATAALRWNESREARLVLRTLADDQRVARHVRARAEDGLRRAPKATWRWNAVRRTARPQPPIPRASRGAVGPSGGTGPTPPRPSVWGPPSPAPSVWGPPGAGGPTD